MKYIHKKKMAGIRCLFDILLTQLELGRYFLTHLDFQLQVFLSVSTDFLTWKASSGRERIIRAFAHPVLFNLLVQLKLLF
jgi:hypothetical protein